MKSLIQKLSLTVAALAATGSLLAGNITVKGSDTLVVLAQKWAEIYMGKHADVKIQVTGGGTGTGFAALQNQTTDICNASRKIKAKEQENCIKAFGKRPTEYKVAMDGLSVYVNADNPISELSLEDLEGIFTGKIKNWKEVGGSDGLITVYSRENSSGTYEFFKEHVLQGKDFAASAQTLQGTAQVLQSVAKDKLGIGYGGAAYGQGAKHLKIAKTKGGEAIEPNEETVLTGKYPISRYLFCYINPALDKGDLAAYLRWIRSDDGQKVVKDVGYYPLPKQFRAN
ncbi:MAG TPA: PstS family phosphate ABC transporter substrate-binding protein [Verrucomicrobiota bacterium]|nr:phosphate-binding protein [Verrucomicrobiales bacterium]HRI14021.1 PstS family phosphate ABC transporter substrate-binding protein [Verrucomicrobiota bacterium]